MVLLEHFKGKYMFLQIEIEELVEKILKAREGYYGGKPIMSDPEYDALEMRLKEIDPENEILKDVGTEFKESSFEKVEHKVPMLSLDKAYSIDDIIKWVHWMQLSKYFDGILSKSINGVGMPKMDGFALSLLYTKEGNKFVLKRGATRGGGTSGEDITENVKQVENIPKTVPIIKGIDDIEEFEVRGETIMKRSTFKELGLDKEYENCRNIAPGSMRQKDPRITKARKLEFVAYNIIGLDFNHMEEKLSFLSSLGFPVVEYQSITLDFENLDAYYKMMEASRDWRDYDIDGIVLCANELELIEELGNTSHHPRGFIAWKFDAEEAETTYNETQWQVSRIGLVNPVGVFNPVRLDGATITNATLHNLTEIERLGLGIGDRIIVSRRGGVIPKIERVVKSEGNYIKIPTVCPVCGAPTRINVSQGRNKEGKEEEIKTLYCTNSDCPAVTLTKILHFVRTMEIDDVAESMITKLMDAGYIETSADLYKVTREQLLTLPNVKDKTADNVLKNIGLSKKRPLGTFLAALGIRTLGQNIADMVADVFGTLDAVLNAKEIDYSYIAGIGPEIAKNIYNGLKTNAELISKLRNEIEIISKKKVSIDSGLPLAGKSFLITGTLSVGRKEFTKLIEENGGEVRDSVSKNLDFLVVGADPGSKVQKAQKAGVKLLTEEDFNKMIGK